MKIIPAIRGIVSIAAVSATMLLGACAAPNAQNKSAAADDEPAPTYVTGSRFPVKDKSQTNVQTGTDLQTSGVRG